MRINGSKMVLEAFRIEGVKTIFGYPGGAIMNVYDELHKQKDIKHILVRHEQAAIHAADGYARASGDVGVAIVTSGPGFTNAVTGIATAYMDSIPIVVVSGQVGTNFIGTDAFQEIDAVGISRPCTKHNFLVKTIEELPRVMKEAFHIARSGRCGPVHVDIPKDITATFGEFDYPQTIKMPTYKPTYEGNKRQIKKSIEAIKKAKKPLFYLGGGVVLSNASKQIRTLIKTTKIPTVETLMARGTLPYNDPCLLGMVGMHGSYASNMAMSQCDLLISLGARFDDRVTGKLETFAKNADIIHVDIDPSSIGKLVNINYPIVGDIKNVADALKEGLKDYDNKSIKDWKSLLKNYNSLHPLDYKDSDDTLKPQWVIQEIGKILGDKAIISTDVGQHQMWTAQFFPFEKERQFLTSGGLGTMGYGFPAALGAKIAKEDKVIVNITGDGSIVMNIQEITTCLQYKIPVINVVLNNLFLGMVRQWQSFFYEDRYSQTDLSFHPDFEKVAIAFGACGYTVNNKKEFTKSFKDAIKQDKVSFVNAYIDKNENVMPMVPSGGALYNMMLGESK